MNLLRDGGGVVGFLCESETIWSGRGIDAKSGQVHAKLGLHRDVKSCMLSITLSSIYCAKR